MFLPTEFGDTRYMQRTSAELLNYCHVNQMLTSKSLSKYVLKLGHDEKVLCKNAFLTSKLTHQRHSTLELDS